MSAPPRFPTIRESDLGIPDGQITGDTLRAVFRRLAATLNPGLDALNTAMAKGLTRSDNFRNDMVTATFQHGIEQKVALSNLKTAASANVLSSESQIVAAKPVVRAIPLTQTGNKPMVGVTIFFNSPTTDGQPSSSKVTLELLEEGIASKGVPPWHAAP